MGVELRASAKGLELPSNPKAALDAKGVGLRASAKVLESPPSTKAAQAAHLAVTSGVMRQKSADGIVAKCPA